MTGCYEGCFYYTDSCFRKDCKKGKAMTTDLRPFPTLLSPYDKSIPGKTVSHFYFGSHETVAVFTDETAVAAVHDSDFEGAPKILFIDQPTTTSEACRLAGMLGVAGYFTVANVQAYWDAHKEEQKRAAVERDRQEYERLKARFEPKEPT